MLRHRPPWFEMDDERLIELVREQPLIYDLSHKKYMDTNYKNMIWNQIGEELGSSAASCKTRWFNIRDNFRKSIQKNIFKTSQGQKTIKLYKYYDQLSFLLKYFGERVSTENISDADETLLECKPEYPESLLEVVSETSPRPEPQLACSPAQHSSFMLRSGSTSPPRERATKRRLDRDSLSTSEITEPFVRETEHPVDMFLASLAPALKELHPIDLCSAKSEIFSIVQKYELKLLNQKYPSHGHELKDPLT